jgi:hypothetical protein
MRVSVADLPLDVYGALLDAGAAAARAGHPDAPPHPRGSREAHAWAAGWRG